MNHVMVRYRVRPGHVEENERLVRAVYAELHERRPDGLRYATHVLDDGVSFVHLASTDPDGGDAPLTGLESFRAFRAGLEDRCDEPPVLSALREVGAYGV